MDITIHLPNDLGHKVREKANNEGVSIVSYIVNTLETQVNMVNPILDKVQEDELMKKIILSRLSSEFWQKYKELTEKAEEGTIKKRERKLLMELIDKKELANAAQKKHLAALAKLRNTSLRSVMEELGIQPV